MKNVPFLYKQCDALLMPTLLESFSGTYVEAMYHKKTIFTSDFDFAKVVCRDVAFYFNPFDENDILIQLEKAFNNMNLLQQKTDKAFRIVNEMDSWKDTMNKYLEIIEKELNNE
jgi:glycosyltransferase involved in cell wall biosynthesis